MFDEPEGTETPFNAEDIRRFFPEEEWKELSAYDKINLFNKKRNYERMVAAGLTPRKPDFMVTDEEKAAVEIKQNQRGRPRKIIQKDAPAGLLRRSIRGNMGTLRKILMKVDEDGDNTLFCDECDMTWIGECISHGVLKIIPDCKVTEDDPARALRSLPLRLNWVEPGNTARGVRAELLIPNRALLGPFKGDVDVEPPATWMVFVKSDPKEANLRPLFYKGGLYFRTLATIRRGEELVLGPAAASEPAEPCGPCEDCGRSFASAPFLQQHQRASPACAASLEQRRLAAQEQRRAALAAVVEQEGAARLQQQGLMHRARQERRRQRAADELASTLAALRRQQKQLYQTEGIIEAVSKDGGVYQCTSCPLKFRRACLFRAHLKKAHNHGVAGVSASRGDLMVCLCCNAKFSSEDHLQNHVLQTHFALKRFTCPKCNTVFAGIEGLEDHMELPRCEDAAEREAASPAKRVKRYVP